MSASIYPDHIIAVADAAAVLSQAHKNYLSARSTGCPEKTEAAGLILDAAQIAYTAAREASAKIKESESPKVTPASAIIATSAKPAQKQLELVTISAKTIVVKEVRNFYCAPTYAGALVEYNYWLAKMLE